MDNPFYAAPRSEIKSVSSGSSTPRWFWPLTIMTFVLGSFIAAALRTQNVVRREGLPSATYSGLAEAYINYRSTTDTMELQQKTIALLLRQNAALDKGVANRSPETKELSSQLDQYRFLAGITPVTGPGIVVTLKDSAKKIPTDLPAQVQTDMALSFTIHDIDIQRVVNELRASGAEAFSINDQRVVTTTAIRCVGAAIQVNNVPLTPPYVIRSIGDPTTLFGALQLRDGIAEQLRQTDPGMIAIDKSTSLQLPSYDGSTMFKYCSPVKPSTTSTASAASDSASIASTYGAPQQ